MSDDESNLIDDDTQITVPSSRAMPGQLRVYVYQTKQTLKNVDVDAL